MTTVEKAIEVGRPVRTVYDQWTQFEDFPKFLSGVKEIRQINDRLTHWVTDFWGIEREFDAEIVEQEPDTRIAWRSIDGETHSGSVTFTPVGDRTRVLVQMAYDAKGFLEKTGDLLGLIGKRVEGDLERFKDFIESRGAPTGSWRGKL